MNITEHFIDEISSHLTSDDDVEFWREAFDTLLTDIEALYPAKISDRDIFLQFGACSYWLRPHQTSWSAGGGFAWPDGYLQKYADHIKNSWGPVGSGLPEFDWFVLAHWNREKEEWEMVLPKFFGKRRLVFRAALPTRTKRHRQAAIHTVWMPGTPENTRKKEIRFYGFRKGNDAWKCVTAGN
jgi:hypothetical protein